MESVKSFRRKMLMWASNWSQEDLQNSTEQVSFTPDAMEIARLLQATGFRVRSMDRCLPKEMYPVPGVSGDSPACRVILMCPRSGIRMELDAQTSTCRCPSPDKSALGDTWRINEPKSEEIASAVESHGSKPSDEISRSVSELIGGLLQVMRLFPDLNHNEIVETAHSKVSMKTEIGLQPESANTDKSNGADSVMKTPATGIAIVTPNAPCVPKGSPNGSKTIIPGRYRSLDTLIAFGGMADDLLPEPGQLTPKDENSGAEMAMEIDGELDTTITHGPGSASKKFISKSSPAVHFAERFEKSDTFTFEDEDTDETGNQETKKIKKPKLLRSDTYVADDFEQEPRAGPAPRRTPSPNLLPSAFNQSSILLSKLQEIQLAVGDVIFMVAGNETNLTNIGDVSKASKAYAGVVQQNIITDNRVRPIRCLSDFGSVPNLGRPSTSQVRSIPRPNMKRYSTSLAAPATPTTSRRGVGGTHTIKKSSTTTPSSKLNSTITSRMNSSNSTISAGGIGQQQIRNSPNSDKKYSHVQSNIPKPGIVRK